MTMIILLKEREREESGIKAAEKVFAQP